MYARNRAYRRVGALPGIVPRDVLAVVRFVVELAVIILRDRARVPRQGGRYRVGARSQRPLEWWKVVVALAAIEGPLVARAGRGRVQATAPLLPRPPSCGAWGSCRRGGGGAGSARATPRSKAVGPIVAGEALLLVAVPQLSAPSRRADNLAARSPLPAASHLGTSRVFRAGLPLARPTTGLLRRRPSLNNDDFPFWPRSPAKCGRPRSVR